ncbi:MAG: hypothetical protein V6Z82_06080, partial [Flavobacteriales bacterium]
KPKAEEQKNKPCPGDPVPHPEIAPQTASGIRGGMFGMTRIDKHGKPKEHIGIDLKNPYGAPDYAMYDCMSTPKTRVCRYCTYPYRDKETIPITLGHNAYLCTCNRRFFCSFSM